MSELDTTAPAETNGTEQPRQIVIDTDELAGIEAQIKSLNKEIDKKNQQIKAKEALIKEYQRRARDMAKDASGEIDQVIQAISELGSHAWRNERSMNAIFKLTQLKSSVVWTAAKIQEDEHGDTVTLDDVPL